MSIDLNADMGEGVGDDDALLGVVTSANVACGFHAGDAETMRRVCAAAAAAGVGVGAHVAYRDREGFGRRALDVDPATLRADVEEQLAALAAAAAAEGADLTHVKPHGALYNRAARDEEQAAAVVAAIAGAPGPVAAGAGARADAGTGARARAGAAARAGAGAGAPSGPRAGAGLPVFGLPGSVLLRLAAQAGLPAVGEAFADRAYEPDGSLRSRDEDGAVLEDAEAVAARAVLLARDRRVVAHDGSAVAVDARTLCLHGDTAGAVRLAHAVRTALATAGVEIRRFDR